MYRQKSKLTTVFWIAILIVGIVIIPGFLFPQSFQLKTLQIRNYIGRNLGWYYLLLITSIVLFCVYLIFSPIGNIRLGDPDSKPEYSKFSWIAMLFSAGMGIGLVFWGAAEPLSHYAISTPDAPVGSIAALQNALKYSFFHWGIHAWATYGIVALALAYFKYRKKEKSLLSITLKPILKEKTDGYIGKIIDSITIFATVIGVATTLGFGTVQINGGLHYLFNVPMNLQVQITIICITTIIFMISSLKGIGKGMKLLSNFNIILAIGLLALAIVVGPSIQILNSFVGSIGLYLDDFFRLSFRTAAYDSTTRRWIQKWTVFYWAWWISWSPFVGVFIARISKGRTIKEFLTNVLLAPTIFSFLWFSTFGTLANHACAINPSLAKLPVETILFGTFAQYKLPMLLSTIAIILVFTFFITSADSATYVLAMLSEDGNIYPTRKTKVIWGVLVSLIAGILLTSGGLDALQNILIIVALPFSIIMVLMIISLFIELNHEQSEMGLYLQPEKYPSKDEPFKSYVD